MKKFLEQFNFKPELAGHIGIERERFLHSSEGKPIPRAKEFLAKINDPLWTYELSACQVEDRTPPLYDLPNILQSLGTNDGQGIAVAQSLGLKLVATPVAPLDMNLEVYPDERYHRIAKSISAETLRAACRVAGIHIHFGMRGLDQAIRAHNVFRKYLPTLVRLGDNSNGERTRLYEAMAPNWNPPEIKDAKHFFSLAREQDFTENPRNCYWLIRISSHGTVELRMFGSTRSRSRIVLYATFGRYLLKKSGIV